MNKHGYRQKKKPKKYCLRDFLKFKSKLEPNQGHSHGVGGGPEKPHK